MKTRTVINNPDGTQAIAQIVHLANQGALACQLLNAIVCSDMSALQDDHIAFSPKKVAIIACDLAEAMYAEMDDRDWLIRVADPDAIDS